MIRMVRFGWRQWLFIAETNGQTFITWGTRRACTRRFAEWGLGCVRLFP